MKRKLFMLLEMAALFLFLLLTAFGKTAVAEAAERKLIASGACGKMHYAIYKDGVDLSFEADESVKYKLYNDGTMVISGRGKMGNFDSWCEGSHTWYRRKELIPWYDYRKDIKKVVVKKGVTTIGSAAFYGCKNLESIQWPDSIKWIGGNAFYGCKGLKSIPWTDNIEYVGYSAFQKCSSLKEVRLPSYVKKWWWDVFAECTNLKKVSVDTDFQFPSDYEENYGKGMFRGCTALEEVQLPKDLTVIPSRFVEGCTNLKVFPIPDNVIYWGSCLPSLYKGKYVLPDSVRTLGDGAFAGCSDLEELILPEGLVSMGRAFEGCSSLKTVKIPESVSVLDETFYNCTGLESIVIPDTVQRGLESVYLSVNNGVGVFEGCSNLESVVLPENMEYIGNSLFKNCTSLKKINLPPELKRIGRYAFAGCSSLTDIKLPDTVYDIDCYAFYDCTSLEEIDIPKGVDVIYYGVFSNCKNLKSVTVRAEEFRFSGKAIFYGCENLSEITLYSENSAYWMGKHTFDGIEKDVTIYVPKGSVNKFKKQFKKAEIDMSKIYIKPMQ